MNLKTTLLQAHVNFYVYHNLSTSSVIPEKMHPTSPLPAYGRGVQCTEYNLTLELPLFLSI